MSQIVTAPSSVPVISWFWSAGEKRTASTALFDVDSTSSDSSVADDVEAEGGLAQTNEYKLLPA